MLALRKASIDDLAEITEIYNEAIINTTATFDTQPKTLAEQKIWFLSHQPNYSILIVEQDSLVVGGHPLANGLIAAHTTAPKFPSAFEKNTVAKESDDNFSRHYWKKVRT